MRTSHKKAGLAAALWPESRRRILGLTLSNVGEEWHVREIVRRTGLSPQAVHRELLSLHGAGILTRRREGRQVYYSADRGCPIFSELRGIVLKTFGLADVLRAALAGLSGRIQAAFIYGSIAEGSEQASSDVDLMVVGNVTSREVVSALMPCHETLGREVNPSVYPVQEFQQKVSEGHHFLTSVVRGPKVFLVGDENSIGELAK